MAGRGPVSVLPRYIALKGDNNNYLALKSNGLLTFDSPTITRLTTHEVLYNVDDASGSFIIRSANQHFWRRDANGWVRADRDPTNVPLASDTDSRFKLAELSSGQLAFQSSATDGLYLKRFHATLHGYAALVSSPDMYSHVEVTDASEHAVSLPRYILIKGDNQRYMHAADISGHLWLKFHGEDNGRTLHGVNTGIPLLDGSLAMYNLQTQGCWWTSSGLNFIHPNITDISQARTNNRCHFEPLKLGSNILALRSKFNNKFCKRLTSTYVDSLSADTDDISDVHAFLTVSDATIRKEVFDVKYLLNLATTTEQRPLAVAHGSVTNNSSFTIDMTVTAVQSTDVTESYTFSNSNSFSQSIETGFKTGIPFLAEGTINVEIGFEQSFSKEWNTTTSTGLDIGMSYLVKDVLPGAQASVSVICSSANMRIPFTYKSRDTAPNGVDRASEEYVDGIFEGVNAYKIEAVISNGTGTTYSMRISPTRKVAL